MNKLIIIVTFALFITSGSILALNTLNPNNPPTPHETHTPSPTPSPESITPTEAAAESPTPSPESSQPISPSLTPTPSSQPQSSQTGQSCYKVTINGQVFEECSDSGNLEFHYSD